MLESGLRWVLGSLAIIVILIIARWPTGPKFAQPPSELVMMQAQELALELAEKQLDLALSSAAPQARQSPVPSIFDHPFSRVGLSVPVKDVWVHFSACLGPNITETYVDFRLAHLRKDERRSPTAELVDRAQGADYLLQSTWNSGNELYMRFSYVLLRKPKAVGDTIKAWVLETATGRWEPIQTAQTWSLQDRRDPEAQGDDMFGAFGPFFIQESEMTPYVRAIRDWNKKRDANFADRQNWYRQRGFQRVNSELPLRAQPLEVTDALELAEINVNREIARRSQGDAELMYLQLNTTSSNREFRSVTVEMSVNSLRQANGTNAFVKIILDVDGQSLHVNSYEAPLFMSPSGAYWAVEVGRCDSELGRRLKVVMVGLPKDRASSNLVWWEEPGSAPSLASNANWSFAGPASGGWLDMWTPRGVASSETCELRASD